MAITTVYTYPLNGSQQDFSVPFEYLARRFVSVTLIGTAGRRKLVLTTDFRFTSSTNIRTNTLWTPSSGYSWIEVRRETSASDRLVDFTDGSILRASDMNVSQVQTLHVAEEARNAVTDTIGTDTNGNLDARGRRVVNLVDAVSDADSVTLGQVKAMGNGAYQSAISAKSSENASANSALAAANSALAAANSKNAAAASESAALTSKNAAAASESSALTYKNAAATSAGEALASKNAAATSASEALDSKNAAATSASAAAVNASTVLAHIASYGANPVGTIVMALKGELPGHLPMNGSTFSASEYPELYSYLGTNVLPDWRGLYPKGAEGTNLGTIASGAIPAHTHTMPAHTHNVGDHTHPASASSVGDHQHYISGQTDVQGSHTHLLHTANTGGVVGNLGLPATAGKDGPRYDMWPMDAAGAHAHNINFWSGAGGAHGHTISVGAGGSGTTSSAGGGTTSSAGSGATVETNRFHVNFFIKAKGLAQA